MSVRKQTLEEWFLSYQLQKLGKAHFHLPFSLDVDITNIENAYRESGRKTPYTAVIVKGVALLAKKFPEMNRMLFPTFYGNRVVDFPYVNVNMPIVQKEGEVPHLSATVVQSADRLRVSEIQTHISDAVKRPFSQTRIGPLLIDRKNSFLNRTLLKLLHFTIYNFPKFYVSKGGGGISVSSLLNHNDADFDFRPVAFGPTAYTFCMTTVKKTPEGRSVLKIGVGWDHRCGGGNEMAEGIKGLSRIMAANDPQTLEQFL